MPLRLTAGITMLTHFVDVIIVFALFVLPQKNLSFDNGKTNSVMPADVSVTLINIFTVCVLTSRSS